LQKIGDQKLVREQGAIFLHVNQEQHFTL